MALIKHVITGGPCTGKTTTVEALKKRGYSTIDEASRILIAEQLRTGGDIVPWKKLHEFNIEVTKLQLTLEAAAKEGIYFLDRGVVDNMAYCAWGKIQPPENLVHASRNAKYHKVFLMEPLPHYEQDKERRESKEEVAVLNKHLFETYTNHGYNVVRVPPAPVRERVELILEHANATSV